MSSPSVYLAPPGSGASPSGPGPADAPPAVGAGAGPALLGALALLAALAAAPEARATVVEAMTLATKFHRSEVVVHGRVEAVRARRRGGSGPIETDVTLQVAEAFRGPLAAGDRLNLRRAGGTLDGVTEWIPGLHRYAPGDEVVLFAEPLGSDGGTWVALGVGVGVATVVRPPGCPELDPNCGRLEASGGVVERMPDGRIRPARAPDASWPEMRSRLRTLAAETPPSPKPVEPPTPALR